MTDNNNPPPGKSLHLNPLSNTDDNLSASHYALKLALQTMKERCQKLQKRLTCLEDENLQLRIERHSVPALVKKEPKSDLSALQKQVEELNRQKSLLCHHIYMVASENKDLWERLSKVTDDKEMLEINLQGLADPTNKSIMKPEKSIVIIDACKSQGSKENSLEEISLKILSSLNKNKTSDNNKNLQAGGELAVRDCEFTLDMEEEEEEDGDSLHEAMMADVNRVLEKLKSEKTVLKQQQEGLKSAINVITDFLKEKQTCKNCSALEEELEKERSSRKSNNSNNNNGGATHDSNARPEPNFNIPKSKENNFEDRICPLCAKFYPKSTPFDEFNEHVLSHFVEEPEQDSLMSFNELIT